MKNSIFIRIMCFAYIFSWFKWFDRQFGFTYDGLVLYSIQRQIDYEAALSLFYYSQKENFHDQTNFVSEKSLFCRRKREKYRL